MIKKKENIITMAVVIIAMIFLSCWYYFAGGTLIKLEIKVVDELGNPVDSAYIGGYFDDSRKGDGAGKKFELITNDNGTCNVMGVARLFVGVRISEKGYYNSSYRAFILRKNNKVLRNISVVLKKITKPIAMQARKVELVLPGLEEFYPFDCDVGDWVEPYGNGKKANIYIYYYRNCSSMFAGTWMLKMKTEDKSTGIQIAEFDEYSKFESMYLAPTSNYTNFIEFVSKSTGKKKIIDTRLREKEYLIFKVQNSTNSAMYNYGKVYHPFLYGPDDEDRTKYKIWFTYYYNPVPDDRNLEFDPQKNLIRTVNRRGKDNSDQFKP